MHLSPTLHNLIATDSFLYKTLKKNDTRSATCAWSERNERRIENWPNIYFNERSEVWEIDRSVSQDISRNWDAVPFYKERFFLSHTKRRQILHPPRYRVTATVLRAEIKDTLCIGGHIVKQALPYTYTERKKMPEIVWAACVVQQRTQARTLLANPTWTTKIKSNYFHIPN